MEATQIILSPWTVIATGIFLAIGWRIGAELMDDLDRAIGWVARKIIIRWSKPKQGDV